MFAHKKTVVIVAFACCVGLLGAYYIQRQSQRNRFQRILRTKWRMQLIAIAAEWPQSTQPTADLVSALRLVNAKDMLDTAVDMATGHVLDEWGNPVWLMRAGDGAKGIVLVSVGPNGVYDEMEADDIVVPLWVFSVDGGFEQAIIPPPGPADLDGHKPDSPGKDPGAP